MAIYRSVLMSFWTDTKVIDDFTPEDRYFYLYLFTNPHTNLCGCYEISKKQVADEMGYSRETVENLLKRFEEVHNVIRYDKTTKELLLLNWHKYNWTASEKFRKPLLVEIEAIKCSQFKDYLTTLFNGVDTVSIPYAYPMDTTVTDTVTVSDTDTNTVKPKQLKAEFDDLWQMYPKKQGKDKAYGYYYRARKNGTTYEEVYDGIVAYKTFIQASETDMQYVKMGSTFFSQKAWQDDWTVKGTKKNANPFTEMLRNGEY